MYSTANTLPRHLHEVLIGYMLGDGGIYYATKKSSTPRFEFSMGQERIAFAQHMADLFKEYATNSLNVVQVKALAGCSSPLMKSYRFKTNSLSVFKYYRELFYKLNPETNRLVKVVPHNIADLLTPVALAYLIMADGNYDAGRNRVRIYTNSFTKSEVEMLANAIKTKFEISAKVMADKPNQYIITIGALELPKLQRLVGQHMHASMKYRIGL